ncbi:MAG TPA: type VI secretion system tube protein Hcp [Pyrinomonadaceae bacterium]|nr:type VI secretion system tube protein Hcp [Pyrinomonadaceae bacterium]
MPIYMKYEGVEGEAKGKYKGWIELESCQLGVNRNINSPMGRGAEREAGAPNIGEIVITKRQDGASTKLFRESLNGAGKKVTIVFADKDGNEYLKLELENTMISSYNVSGYGGDANSRPMESLSLNFIKVTITAKPISKDAKKNEERIQWDLATQ